MRREVVCGAGGARTGTDVARPSAFSQNPTLQPVATALSSDLLPAIPFPECFGDAAGAGGRELLALVLWGRMGRDGRVHGAGDSPGPSPSPGAFSGGSRGTAAPGEQPPAEQLTAAREPKLTLTRAGKSLVFK